MELQNRITPPIERSSRDTVQLQSQLDDMIDELRFEDADEVSDETDDAAPPPIRRSRSTSLDSATPPKNTKRLSIPPLPRKSSLRIEPEPALLPEPLRLPTRQKTEPSWIGRRAVPESPRTAQGQAQPSTGRPEQHLLNTSVVAERSTPVSYPAQQRHISQVMRTTSQNLEQSSSQTSELSINSASLTARETPEPNIIHDQQHTPDTAAVAEQQTAVPERRPSRHSRNFSHPFNEQPLTSDQLAPTNLQKPLPKAPSPRHKYYRSNSRLPPSLRRWSSLETIASVATAPEVPEDSKADSASVGSTTTGTAGVDGTDTEADEGDVESSATPRSYHSVASTVESSSESGSIRPSESNSVRRSRSSSLRTNSNQHPEGHSLLRKLKLKKVQEPLLEPTYLEIERTVSVDQTSVHRLSVHRTDSSSSIGTISSGPPSLVAYPSSEASRGSRKTNKEDWKASTFDVSQLSEAELKKCKKKGINPALFAEMKAARKGKWASPIGGNTFL